MSATWQSDLPPDAVRIGVAGWLRVALKGGAIAGAMAAGLSFLLLLRLVERPLHGARRPWTPWITQGTCRAALAILGLRRHRTGQPIRGGVMVANHVSWLDILVLNASARVCFVAKAEVAGWPGIGWLARATGTVFIRRDRREAAAQRALLRQRLAQGHQLLFFPEGTSTDGRRVLPFRTALFDAFLDAGLRGLEIQPVALIYHAPPAAPARFYGWWGDMALGPHLAQVLAAPRQGRVDLHFHPALIAADFPGRKALALACETAVRRPLAAALAGQ